jgi:GNAT superfamily N-acetyltransferase
VFDIPEDHRTIFAYESLYGKTTLIGGVCFRIADKGVSAPDASFDSEFYHVIAFLFVKGDFQGQGIGRRLLYKATNCMINIIKRPIRVQSAEKAVPFFEKMGFMQVKAPFESMCGPRLFRFLYNMEKDVK